MCVWPNGICDVHDEVNAPGIVLDSSPSSGGRIKNKLESGLRDPDGDRAKKASTDPS